MDAIGRSVVVLVALGGLLGTGCAGDLENPDRFDFLLGDAGSGSPPDTTGDGDGDTGDTADASGDGDGDGDAGDGDAGDGDAGDGDAAPEELPACVAEVLVMRCGSPGCHAANQTQIDLVSPNVADRLLDQESPGLLCSNRKFISTDGSGSLLLQKLEPDVDCGSVMPLGGMLDSEQKQCLTDWVDSLGGDLP